MFAVLISTKYFTPLLKSQHLLKMASRKVLVTKQTNIANFFVKPQKRSSSTVEDVAHKVAKRESNESSSDSITNQVNVPNEQSSPEPLKKVDTAKSSLSPEQRDMIERKKQAAAEKLKKKSISTCSIGESWEKALKGEFEKDYFKKLTQFLSSERSRHTVYPPENDVFSWTNFTDITDTKVVIIGQDPYHGPKQAHGLCFSVQIGVPPPPSLKNMYKELQSDIPGFVTPNHGHLVGWASQGVLLLNACLTVVANQANSHKDRGWEKFTDATIKWINLNLDNVVFLLWGMYAQKKGQTINKSRHRVLSGTHPSPLSAHRGFFGCKHFSKTNEYLKEKGKKEINWTFLPESI